MKRVPKIETRLEPRLIGITFTMSEDGSGRYMITTQANVGSHIKQEAWGIATPQCGHLKCRWVNLAAAAADWAELAIPGQGLAVVHPEQLGVAFPAP